MGKRVAIVGGGLAGSEAALYLASQGVNVHLYEMRPVRPTEVHHTDGLAELVCSNSLKSEKPDSAAGMLKEELRILGSSLYEAAVKNRVAAGGALAVDRTGFSETVTMQIESHPNIELLRREVLDVRDLAKAYDAVVLATGPLTSDALAESLEELCGTQSLAFFDAAAPIVMADSLDMDKVFKQSRYEESEVGDYLNSPFTKDEYENFIEKLVNAKRVVARDFETADLFQACQPIEEIARKGKDAPRFGALKPVGLTDPSTGKRPWAALQLRAEDANCQSFNLVGFQTNLTFPEQKRVFRLIPGLENAEFARYGVMHRNTYLDAPRVLDSSNRLITSMAQQLETPVYIAGQLAGTEGYCEAIRSGLHVGIQVASALKGIDPVALPKETVYGSLLAYSTDPETKDYQPMHVNFGIIEPLEKNIRNKRERYGEYAKRGSAALARYAEQLESLGLLNKVASN